MSRVWSGQRDLNAHLLLGRKIRCRLRHTPILVPSSGNDPEPPGFQPGAQTIYATTADWSRRWGSNPTLPLYQSGAQTTTLQRHLIPKTGVEPAHPRGYQPLKLARLPSSATWGSGPGDRDRTCTALRPQRSERCASARNSATPGQVVERAGLEPATSALR
jgi:hypothetical protein